MTASKLMDMYYSYSVNSTRDIGGIRHVGTLNSPDTRYLHTRHVDMRCCKSLSCTRDGGSGMTMNGSSGWLIVCKERNTLFLRLEKMVVRKTINIFIMFVPC